MKLASNGIESFTPLTPSTARGSVITFGPYKTIAPLTVSLPFYSSLVILVSLSLSHIKQQSICTSSSFFVFFTVSHSSFLTHHIRFLYTAPHFLPNISVPSFLLLLLFFFLASFSFFPILLLFSSSFSYFF